MTPSSYDDAVSLKPLLSSRRVVLCVGCGGVGKTTTAAALGLAAAMSGKRTLCLTIDPARRLAESLGLTEMKTEAQRIDPARFQEQGIEVPGSLTVMMLDTKRTFDELVARHASSPEVRDRILGNRLYQQVSTSLAGTQEYMAMEKLYSLKGDRAWDLIILDTPPTTNALDFLDAPERMAGALDSAVLHWLVTAFQTSGKFSLNLLTRGASAVLKGMGKLTGYGFLEALSEFISLINDLFGGFKKRAAEVSRALRGPDVAYVLVTSPDPMSLREIVYFADRLREQGMARDALVINRLQPAGAPAAVTDIAQELARRGVVLGEDGPARVELAAQDEARRAAEEAKNLETLATITSGRGAPIVVKVPAFAGDVHDLRALARVAGVLCP